MNRKGDERNVAMPSRPDLRAEGQPLPSFEYQHSYCIFHRQILRPFISEAGEEKSCG